MLRRCGVVGLLTWACGLLTLQGGVPPAIEQAAAAIPEPFRTEETPTGVAVVPSQTVSVTFQATSGAPLNSNLLTAPSVWFSFIILLTNNRASLTLSQVAIGKSTSENYTTGLDFWYGILREWFTYLPIALKAFPR